MPWLAFGWGLVVALDVSTGRHVSMNGLYLLPLVFTTWCLGRLPGLLLGVVTTVTTISINGFGDGLSAQATTVPASVAAWNAGMRIFGVAFIILLVGAFRRTFDRERLNARVDPLTGLANRRAFEIDTSKLALSGLRTGRTLMCGLIDLDDFKSLNDVHGHAAGDDLLRRVAGALSSSTRPYDVIARLGGDEFAFCLLVRDRDAALRKARDIHVAVSSAMGTSTCSLGAATDVQLSTAMPAADRAMYRAKACGKGTWSFEDASR